MIENAAVLPETVAQKLRADIITQRDAPGSAITESAVALRFGVARPTARIAIDRLVADGILRREAHRAARVPELSYDDVLDLFDTRSIVETAAMVALAEAGAIPAEALAAHRALTATDDFAHHDIQFHRALVAGQPSSRLTRLHELLMGEVELCIGQVQSAQLITAHEVAEQHQGVLDAITAGDVATAERLTRDHILGARDRLLTHLDTDTNLDTNN
ncbi:GntR family transcriptional regulator [Salinibacterium sp. SWN248]|uniref:GntR family transcriptional regulator n=1 Tax=Salinibacterium sp. SWN248 TaxID=2792056 RepID=UPI0018CF4995|nr:GntR family transcriptional regulator [Salinibacterium sp. SWN248]MBH0022589.1 GntR family transcriptional regulator [Salinibacterium sp. SWN248]